MNIVILPVKAWMRDETVIIETSKWRMVGVCVFKKSEHVKGVGSGNG